jgi:hypothetical protein
MSSSRSAGSGSSTCSLTSFLIDPERAVQRDLDIVEYTDPYHNPMIPHTLVLEPGLVIYTVYNGYWHWGRPSPAQLRADLRAVTEKVRADWDITAPGQRDAWERATRALSGLTACHCGRSSPQTPPPARNPTPATGAGVMSHGDHPAPAKAAAAP